MWNLKLKVMASIGAFSIAGGVLLRFLAKHWSRDNSGTTDYEAIIKIVEAGTWAIFFGIIVLALALNQWVSGDPKRDTSATPEQK